MSSPDEAVITETPVNELDAIENLLNPPAQTADTGEPVDPVEPGKEVHKEEMREWYAKEVVLSNGEKTTAGVLKDSYQDRLAQEATIIERENKLMLQARELHELAETLNTVPDHLRQQAVQQREQYVKAEFQSLLVAIPEWKEAAAFDSGRKAVFSLAAEYGLESDMSAVVDHRVVKLMHDFARLKGNIKQAKEQLVSKSEDSVPVGRKPLPQPAANPRPKGQQAQLAAIDALLT